MSLINQYDQIERYISGELTDEELVQFEQNIQADSALEEEVALHRELQTVLKDHDFSDFRAVLAKVAEENPPVKQQTTIRTLNWWILSVAAIVLLAIAFWLLIRPQNKIDQESPVVNNKQKKSKPSLNKDTLPAQNQPVDENLAVDKKTKGPLPPINPEKPQQIPKINIEQRNDLDTEEYLAVAADFYDQYDGGVLKGENDEEALMAEINSAFLKEDWKKTLQLMQQVDANTNDELLKIRAAAYFKNKQFSNATLDFKKLAGEKESLYKYNAEWNLLMCYLVQLPKERENFNSIFNSIKGNPDHPFFERFKVLESRLGQKK